MRYLVTVRTSFDAGHHLPDSAVCDKPGHGHHWTVEIEADGELGPRKRPFEERLLLLADLRDFVKELDGRDLNRLLPASTATPENIAIQFLERLRFKWPRITRVTVSQDEATSVSILNEAVP